MSVQPAGRPVAGPAARPLGRRLRAGAAAATLLVAGSCSLGPTLAPNATSTSSGTPPGPSSSATELASPTASPPADLRVPGLPRLLWASTGGGFLASASERPAMPRPVNPPEGAWRPAAATGPDGLVLLTADRGASRPGLLVTRLEDDRLHPLWSRTLPAALVDPTEGLLPGCLAAPDPVGVFEATTLTLIAVPRAGEPRTIGPGSTLGPPGTLGRCQMDGPGRLLYLTEDLHALVSRDLGSGAVASSSTRCDDFGAAGGRLACVEPGGNAWSLGTMHRFNDGQPALVRLTARRLAPEGVAQLDLSPDGAWLALRLAGRARISLLRVSDLGVTPAAEVDPPEGATFLGFVGDRASGAAPPQTVAGSWAAGSAGASSEVCAA